jgi:hypothetical protein
MVLSLSQTQAAADLAEHLYDYLPGKPHPYADARISFEGVARSLGVERFWSGGSKLPALTQLLTLTLEHKPKTFCTLVVEIVRRGITYRQRKNPVTRAEITALNELIARLKFRIKDLHDPAFLEGLPAGTPKASALTSELPAPSQLKALQQTLMSLSTLEGSARGLAFERFLNELFTVFGLAPRGAFRLRGEQIDGSFVLEGETYLLEAKWTGDRTGQEELLVFSGKIGGKAQWARGLFLSLSGFTAEGLEAFGRGKPTNLICMEGLDLYHVLEGKIGLRELLVAKARRAAEEGIAFVSVRELIPAAV